METRSINNSFEIFGYEEEEIERTTVCLGGCGDQGSSGLFAIKIKEYKDDPETHLLRKY